MNPIKVNLVIIGVGKAGTTSLAKWLSNLDDCCFSEPKETMFFGSDRLYEKGFDWYQKTFYPHFSGQSIVAEGTPAYSDRAHCGSAASRIYSHNPGAKIIYMVRDPLDRVVSAWKMWTTLEPTQTTFGNHLIACAKNGFNKWMEDPVVYENMVNTSRYNYQLEAWDIFPQKQQHVIFLEDLKRRKEEILEGVSRFLGIDSGELLKASSVNYNTGESRSVRTPFRRMVEGTRLWKSIRKYIPPGLKSAVAKSSIGSLPVTFEQNEWNPELRQQFLKDIELDNLAFLNKFGKPSDFWVRK
jgi:hypothetical protein